MKLHFGTLTFKRYGLVLIAPLFCAAIAVGVLEAYFDPLYGDLTRIGRLDEGDFGWREPQPAIPAEQLRSWTVEEADILIIGDSFSQGLIWQSRLVQAGFRPGTVSWSAFNPCGLRGNLSDILRRAGFKGRYVVLESVEHGFQSRLKSTCDVPARIQGKAYTASPPATDPPPGGLRTLPGREPLGGSWVIGALANKLRLNHLADAGAGYMEFGGASAGRARVVPFEGCAVFSHRRCRLGLFYSHDFGQPTFDSIGKVQAISRDLQAGGMQAVWVVVPDKSTVYLGYGKPNVDPYVNVWRELARHPELAAPDLAEAFMRESRTTRDFYKPNDTHLSTRGYLYLGGLMVDFIRSLNRGDAGGLEPRGARK